MLLRGVVDGLSQDLLAFIFSPPVRMPDGILVCAKRNARRLIRLVTDTPRNSGGVLMDGNICEFTKRAILQTPNLLSNRMEVAK